MVTDPQVSFANSHSNLICGFTVNANERMELEFLRTEVSKLRESVGVRIILT
jgi:hypothetical protein